ncbi:mediator of DNA damage checkpoint protein 1-like isoform X2 [Salvelinus alpinus]|uniref:mediator of DNA damage checkpoint protein 1-like isoform X2 n=1 Tax=Salvelinus alpinus TaxID=8036 RepID=UPI0039FD6E83
MEATQLIDDSILEESEEEDGEMRKEKRGEPLAKLRVLKNEHISETELPLYQGENVLGRNPNSCSLPLVARSVSKQHTVISISMFHGNRCHGNVAAMETEAFVWDLGSMNGTRKGRTKLTPHVRYALTEGECVVIADIPCQYVSVDQRGGQGHMQNPINAHSGRGRRTGPDRKAQFRGSPIGHGLGRKTGTPKTERPTEGRGVNGEMGAPSLTELGGKGQTRAIPLLLEQTPTQPERTLVPESESDSDGDREGRRDKRGKYFVSDSDSHMSSPTCSTFLSPTNKVIPESEDDRPITHSSAKNRPKKVVSFSEEESDMDGPRKHPRRRRAQVIVDDSEEEGKEGTEALGEKETGKRTRGKEDVSLVNQVSQVERDRLTPSAPMSEVKFNMDSDTDVEGEEEMGLSAPVNSVTPPDATEPPTTDSDPGQIHMDSDTDVEEGDTMDGDSKLMLTAADVERKPVDSVPVVQQTEIHLDSDTDVDDDVVVSDSATNVTSFVSDPVEKPDGSGPAVPPVEFHLDTDTDVEEEDTDIHSKTVPESDSSGIRTGIAGHQEILLDSDTDEEDNPFAPPASSRTAELLNPPTSVGPAAAAPLEIRSDSDTDLEEDATQTMNLPPPNVAMVTEDAVLASRQAVLPSPTTTITGAVTTTIALRSQDSDADTDAEEERLEPKPPRCRPPAGMVPESDLSEPSDFRMDSDTEQDGPGEAGQGHTGGRLREGAAGPGLLPLGGSPGLHQKCSTPLASSVQEEMETQAFLSPSDPFRHPALPPVLRPTAALSCSASDSQEDDDFVVAETQSFVLEAQNQGHQSSLPVEPTLDATQPYGLEPSLGEDQEEQPSRGSFHLGLSDSSHLQARDQASESTQAFSFPDGDSDLEASQTYGSGGGSEEPGLRSAVFGRNRQVDFVLEATQAYAAQPCSDTEEEDEEETPTTSNVDTTETLPMSAYGEEEEDLVGAMPSTPIRRGRSGGARDREEEEQETQTGDVLINQYLSTAQTLDIVQESDDEEEAKPDSPRGRGRSQEQTVDEEETQTVCSYLSTAETQPMFTAAAAEDNDDNEEEELKPPSPRRRARSQRGRVEEEETPPSEFLTSSHISTAETQPMGTCDTEEEKEEDTKDKGRAQRGRGKESEAGTSGVSSRGRRGARGGEEEEEGAETPKTQTRGKGKAVNTAGGRGRRGKVLSEEGESEKEEEVEVVEQGRRRRKSVKQQKEGEKERLEEGIEKERQEQAEKERLQKEKVESERVMKEQQESERMEQELKEQYERLERERVERRETERMEREEREQEERERLERERKEREEQESREREALERERVEREEKERIEGEQAENERLEKERKEILEKEKMEREEMKKQERERLKKNKEEKERLDREMKERDLKEKLEREKKEREKREAKEKEKEIIKEQQVKEQGEKQTKKDNENEPKTCTRGRRAITRRTVTVPPTTEPQPELDILSSQPEPVPASITRSRSNSVSSERSTSNIGTQGRKTTSTTEPAPGPDNPTRNSTRRRTLVGTVVAPPTALEVTVQDILSSEQFVARRTRSRSSSTNSHSSLNSEVSTCIAASMSSQSKGRGGGRRKTGTESVSPSNRQSEQPPAPKPPARGRRSQKVEDYGPQPEINEKADSQEAGGTTRGQKKTDKTNEPDPVVADEETTPAQVTEDSPAPRGNGRGRGRGGQKDNTPESTTTTAGGDTPSEEGVESKTGGRKKGLEEEQENSGFKVPRRKAKVQREGRRRAAEEGEKEENPASTPAKRGRASTAQVKKIAEEESMEGQSEKMEEAGTVQRKVRGRQSTVQIKKEEESVLDSNSVTPTGKGRGKRRAPVESSPFAKTPRSASPLSSLSSPGTLGRARASTQSYKVLFTGVVDEEGGKVVSRLGGSLAKGVADMTHLVTDRIRRTVKFLCAVARGVPVVTTDWLDKCGKVSSFLPTDRYLVKDREQENKFSFCLEESLRTASIQPLLQGYEVHVTRSVLPQPAQMKDIIVCSGARFLSKMPSTQKAQARTLVISCGEDWSLCAPAFSASLPVLSAEFLLTGILQQRVDLVTHVLSAPKLRAQPGANGQASGRKRT